MIDKVIICFAIAVLGTLIAMIWYYEITTRQGPTKGYLFIRNLYINYNSLYLFFLQIRMVFSNKDNKDKLKNEFKTFVPSTDCIIRMTWMPNNHITERNAYIGEEGNVEDVRPDGSFVLQCKTHTIYIGRAYTFEYISAREYFSEIRLATEADLPIDQNFTDTEMYIMRDNEVLIKVNLVNDKKYNVPYNDKINMVDAEQFLINGTLYIRDFEPGVHKPFNIKIVSCDSKFKWYFDKKDKIFEVEHNKVDDMYRTIEDVAGPGCKGFIEVKDIIKI